MHFKAEEKENPGDIMKKLISFTKLSPAIMIVMVFMSAHVQAKTFPTFPVQENYTGAPAQPKFSNLNGTNLFKSEITKEMRAGVNFAGKYTWVEIGCGSSCVNAYAVNRKTGNIIKFPLGGEKNYQLMMDYKKDSRLVKAVWTDDEAPSDKLCVIDFYDMLDDRFLMVQHNRKPAQDGYCDSYMD